MSGAATLQDRLQDRAELFLATMRARGYSEKTLTVYRSDLKRMVAWFGAKVELKALGDIGRGEMMEYAGHLLTVKGAKGKSWTAMTRNRHLSTVRSFFKFLAKSGVLLANPATSLEMFKAERKLPVVPSVDDIFKLLAAIDITTHRGLRDRAATEILYGSGLRISELLDLDLYDVDFLEGLLHVRHGKGDKARLVPMVPEAMKALLAYLEVARPKLANSDEKALFVSVLGHRMKPFCFGLALKKYAKKAAIRTKVTPHTLRHSCATHLLKGQAGIRHIQALLGHAALSTTQVYTRVEVSDLVAVVRRCHPRERF